MSQKQRMLRHKETGELFIWTPHYEKMEELEEVKEDMVAEVINEMRSDDNDPLSKVIVAADTPPLETEKPNKRSKKSAGE